MHGDNEAGGARNPELGAGLSFLQSAVAGLEGQHLYPCIIVSSSQARAQHTQCCGGDRAAETMLPALTPRPHPDHKAPP